MNRNLSLVLALGLGMASPAAFAEPGSLASELSRCARIAGAESRLQCFDQLAADSRSGDHLRDGLEQTPESAGRPWSPDESSESVVARFGFEQERLRLESAGPGALPRIRARTTAVSAARDGRIVVELDNDQAWLVLESAGTAAPPAIGAEITIRRASLGSFLMATENRRSFRVRRLR